ncbi:hypothetical protein TorRG33x02_128150 [Trema orientale]|uniref:Uncharacterized protein n=1 Tax=Trema orientale TaxID=63057 RepID=A0A2P5F0D0_TREOI|nr:hypothetical protein TorRG33x02_128150 [Trema orientale]
MLMLILLCYIFTKNLSIKELKNQLNSSNLEKLASEFVNGCSTGSKRSGFCSELFQLWQASSQLQSHFHLKQLPIFSFLELTFSNVSLNLLFQELEETTTVSVHLKHHPHLPTMLE